MFAVWMQCLLVRFSSHNPASTLSSSALCALLHSISNNHCVRADARPLPHRSEGQGKPRGLTEVGVVVVQEAKCSWLDAHFTHQNDLAENPWGCHRHSHPLHGTRLACTSRNHAILLFEHGIVAVVGEVNQPTPHTFLVHSFERESSSSSGFPFAHTVCMFVWSKQPQAARRS